MGKGLSWEEKQQKRLKDEARTRLINQEAAQRDARQRGLVDARQRGLVDALRRGGEDAYAFWQAHRTQMVKDQTLAPDVVVTPLAWVPQWPPPPMPEPLPPTPTVLDAAQVTADLLLERPAMSREDYLRLGRLIARIKLLHAEMGWQE